MVLKDGLAAGAEGFAERVEGLVKAAAERASMAAVNVTPYEHLGMLAVDGPAQLIRELVRSPAVKSASLMSRGRDAYIPPVNKKKVRLGATSEKKTAGTADRKRPTTAKPRPERGGPKS